MEMNERWSSGTCTCMNMYMYSTCIKALSIPPHVDMFCTATVHVHAHVARRENGGVRNYKNIR